MYLLLQSTVRSVFRKSGAYFGYDGGTITATTALRETLKQNESSVPDQFDIIDGFPRMN